MWKFFNVMPKKWEFSIGSFIDGWNMISKEKNTKYQFMFLTNR